MRRLLIASLALIACGGAAPAPHSNTDAANRDEARLAKALNGLTPGKPVSCISQFRPSYSTETIGDVILYKVNKRLVYTNNTGGGCSASPGGDTLVLVNYGYQLCSGTIVRTIDPFANFTTGSCALGNFTPYTRAK